MMKFKQVILVRKDLRLTKGKMAAQVSHASVDAALRSSKVKLRRWRSEGMKKSVLAVQDLKELLRFKRDAERAGLITSLITDAGHTHLLPGTVTCLGIGPDAEEKIDVVTGKLKLIS